jgi:hypothetical protein
MNLDEKERTHYFNLEKGFEGEKVFDKWLMPNAGNGIILNDLLFETNHTSFQIDSLFFKTNTIFMFEVKNYEGDFYLEGDKWFSPSKREIKSPLLQLRRSESLFRRLLQENNVSFTVEGYLVFVNPEFHLYQAPPELPIIFPSQLNRFAMKLNRKSGPLKEGYSKLAEKLLGLHVEESPYSRLPKYRYEEVGKGVLCRRCHSLYHSFNKSVFICGNCKNTEAYLPAVLRSIEEFKFLFPERKITTDQIQEWCKLIKMKRTIRKILYDHFEHVGHGKSSHFVDSLIVHRQ